MGLPSGDGNAVWDIKLKLKNAKLQTSHSWDATFLAEEQMALQGLYDNLSDESFGKLESLVKKTAGFKGDLKNVRDRWAYGMQQMGYDVKPSDMPDIDK